MKNRRRSLSYLTIIVSVLCFCLLAKPSVLYGAETGTSIENATETEFDTSYSDTWNADSNYFYRKIEVPATGIVTIQTSKPINAEGQYERMYFVIYDEDEEHVWGNNTYYSVNDGTGSYVLHVGLDAGTYYVAMKPGFYIKEGSVSVNTTLTYEEAVCEIESNDSKEDATEIAFYKNYIGHLGSEGSEYEKSDYFAIAMDAGVTYYICFGNMNEVSSTTMLIDIIDTNGISTDITKSLKLSVDENGVGYYEYVPVKSGTHYVQVRNYARQQIAYNITVTRSYIARWVKDITGWRYVNADGTFASNCWMYINNSWYAFDEKGYMREGWFKDGNYWYYLEEETGAMLTGWVQDGSDWYYMDASGAMQTGWVYVNQKWYYLNASGAMATEWVYYRDAWYYLDSETGAMATGWVQDGKKWYYLNASGAMLTGWVYVNGEWYYMNASGAMLTGWVYVNGEWYYMNASGAMQTGWVLYNGSWYYLNEDGDMAASEWIDNKYYVNSDGMWTQTK